MLKNHQVLTMHSFYFCLNHDILIVLLSRFIDDLNDTAISFGVCMNDRFQPFLRWAGGKTWLTKHLPKIIGDMKFNNYHEPFLGGGAIFFALSPSKEEFLSDVNCDLIETYIALRDNPELVIKKMKSFENTETFYYMLRDKTYNDIISRAARFIYLNQTSYNGIYRVNLKGIYNVPYGYRNKPFLEETKLLKASQRLKNSTIECHDFDLCIENIGKGDLVFLDPPYTVSHNNNGFIKYNQKLFSLEDQYRLKELIQKIKAKKAYYILTNAAHEKIIEIFHNEDQRIEMQRSSLIGGHKAMRGQVSEYIFTNISE